MAKKKHTHSYDLAYISKLEPGKTVAVYICSECKHVKRDGKVPDQKRLSNMGGEFSTNWRP